MPSINHDVFLQLVNHSVSIINVGLCLCKVARVAFCPKQANSAPRSHRISTEISESMLVADAIRLPMGSTPKQKNLERRSSAFSATTIVIITMATALGPDRFASVP